MSRESLRRFYEAHNDPKSKCRKDGGAEDAEIAICLRTKDVYPGKALDKQNRELFHPLPFGDHFRGSVPDWLVKNAENPLQSVRLSKEICFVIYLCIFFSITIVVVINLFHSIMLILENNI